MHEELWAAVESKLESAQILLRDAGRDLPGADPATAHMRAVVASVGAICIDPNWEKNFYAHLDSFLALARSIPDVIQTCFGADPWRRRDIKKWFDSLDPAEQKRREDFQSLFSPHYDRFSKLKLSRARVSTLHWGGAAPVEVKMRGQWGDVYVGGPLKRLPSSEIAHSPGSDHIVAGDDAGLQWAASQPPVALEPKPGDFSLVTQSGKRRRRKPLFAECSAYLVRAERLIRNAKQISRRVHGTQKLAMPPRV